MLDIDSTRAGADPTERLPRFGEFTTPELRAHARVRRLTSLSLLAADIGLAALCVVLAVRVAELRDWFISPSLRFGAVLVLAVPPVFALLGLYRPKRFTISPIDEARTVATGVAWVGILGVGVGAFVLDESATRGDIRVALLFSAFAFVALLGVRSFSRRLAAESSPDRVLIVGAGEIGQRIAQRVATAGSGRRVVGFVDDEPLPLHDDLVHLPVFPKTVVDGGIERLGLVDAIAASGATQMVLAFSRRTDEDVLEYIRDAGGVPIPISIVPRYFEITPPHAEVADLHGMPVVTLSSARLSVGARATKRATDILFAGAGLVLISPLLLAIAVAIRVDSPGPVFFRQERVGSRGRVFRIWKFRTMRPDAESQRFAIAHLNEMEGAGPLFKMKNDPRVTRVGRFLRKTSLDELPQLFNVVGGSMSLVGPRPFVTHEAIQIGGWGARRLDLKPGITGLWQVMGRNDVPFDEMVRLDYMYVTNWSVWWDMRLLLQTIPRVLKGNGAS